MPDALHLKFTFRSVDDSRMETGYGRVRGHSEYVWKTQTALERAGVQFIDEHDSGGAGVRLKQRERR